MSPFKRDETRQIGHPGGALPPARIALSTYSPRMHVSTMYAIGNKELNEVLRNRGFGAIVPQMFHTAITPRRAVWSRVLSPSSWWEGL